MKPSHDLQTLAESEGARVTEHVLRAIRLPSGLCAVQALMRGRSHAVELDSVRRAHGNFTASEIEGVVHSLFDSFHREIVITQGIQLTLE